MGRGEGNCDIYMYRQATSRRYGICQIRKDFRMRQPPF